MIVVRGVILDPLFVKLCREHPERMTMTAWNIVDGLCVRLRPRIRVKAISRRVA